jgi:hypothetical protein
MDKLKKVIASLPLWRQHAKKVSGRCLEAMQVTCGWAGIHLPMNQGSALNCFYTINAHPEKWGLKHITRDANGNLPDYCIVFYKRCGWVKRWGRYAGHIGILHHGTIYGNVDFTNNAQWGRRLIGAFVPV